MPHSIDVEELRDRFWYDVFARRGATNWVVARDTGLFTLLAFGVVWVDKRLLPDLSVGIAVAPYEVAGAALGLLLVLRTNAGYDRWWEARRLWGGIVNASRNVVLTAAAHGPDDPKWLASVARWTAVYAHVCRRGLRLERDMPEVAALVGPEAAARLASARHMPSEAARQLDGLLREGFARAGGAGFAFQEALRRRAELIDHVGGCERILKAPLPRVYDVNIRRFLVLFLAALPWAMIHRVDWLAPLVTLLVSYPLLALDEIGAQLQNPFWTDHLGHLPLDRICAGIEADVLALAAGADPPSAPADGPLSSVAADASRPLT